MSSGSANPSQISGLRDVDFVAYEICERLRSLKKGQLLTYHIGYLDHDRSLPHVRIVANVAIDMYNAKQVTLVQKRVGVASTLNSRGDGFEYIAIGLKE